MKPVVRDRIELSTFRFSGECLSPRESTAGYLSSSDDGIAHFGVHDRPCASTAVVSRPLAVGFILVQTA
jgi:hypothetical protein